MPTRDGVGIYAAQLMESLPFLPVEEEGRLGDPILGKLHSAGIRPLALVPSDRQWADTCGANRFSYPA